MEAAAAREKIQALTEKIEELNQRYYQNSESPVSDQEFDLLLKRLQELEEAFPELADPNSPTQRVGGTITKNFKQATHQYRMLSLGNTYSPGELQDFDGRVAKGLGHRDYAYCCELKFDGVAISLIYEQGRLVRAVTRGDGTQGDVVTENVKTIRSIPLHIAHPNLPERFEVRGEVFLPRKEFDRINAERQKAGEQLLANPRNAASGTLKMQDSSIVAKRRLDCYCYQLLGENLGLDTHEEATAQLEAWGFHVSPTYKLCADIQEVFAYIKDWEEKRHSLPVDTDGVVLKLNDFNQREELGFTAKIPRWAIAYKYAAESMPTRLLGIQYQVGRTGAITPVAQLQAVALAGTVVKRASLHNANEIQRLGLHEGDTVQVEKGGEIIPKVTGVVEALREPGAKPVRYIAHCPECGSALERQEGEAKHFCPNSSGCPPQILGRMEHFISKRALNIDSLGTERLRTLIDQGFLKTFADFYRLPEQQEALLGLEMSQDQYTKAEDGSLYIQLAKGLYGITEGLSLSQWQQFSAEHPDTDSAGIFREAEAFIREKAKKTAVNLGMLTRFREAYQAHSYPAVADFLPLAPLLYSVLHRFSDLDTLRKLCRQASTTHQVLRALDQELPAAVEKQVARFKGSSFQSGVLANMVKGIEASRQMPFEKVLFAIGIRHVGENTAQLLAEHFGSLEALMQADLEALAAVNGIGETVASSVRAYFQDTEQVRVLRELEQAGLAMAYRPKAGQEAPGSALKGMKILASGKLDHFSREEIVRVVEAHGGSYVKTVSKSLDFIIAGEDMGPSKREKAEKLGVKLLTEAAFLALIEKENA